MREYIKLERDGAGVAGQAVTAEPGERDPEYGRSKAARRSRPCAGRTGRFSDSPPAAHGGKSSGNRLVTNCSPLHGWGFGAWAELVRNHHRRVYGLCYRFTGNPTDAEDLTQDVFLKVYSNLGSFDKGRGSLQVWITTMTRNLLVDNFRRTRNQRATSSLDEGWESTEELKPVDRLTSRGPSPHESAAQKELAKMVQEALARVSVELREAVILRDLQDLDYKEIAQVLGIPEGTVKSRISRGRAELARLLERNKREVM